MDKWYITDLKKIINWKKVNTDGATLARKKDLLVLWDLVRWRSEEDMCIYGGVNSEVFDHLCKVNEQHQSTSVLI